MAVGTPVKSGSVDMTRLFQCCLIWLSGTFSAALKALLAALAGPLLYLRVCDAEWYGPLLLLHH